MYYTSLIYHFKNQRQTYEKINKIKRNVTNKNITLFTLVG